MKNKNTLWSISLGLALFAVPFFVSAQTPAPAKQLLKRVVTKTDKATFGAGGTVTVIGGPVGSVTVEGWSKNLVEVTAEIELQAESEADLAMMAQVNGFVFDPSMVNVSVLTMGMHDKDYMKKNAKKFPKRLLNMPWKIDYVVRAPAYSDLVITVGRGTMKITGFDGTMQLKGAETNAELNLTGGTINATFGVGNVNVNITGRSWRGRNFNLQVAKGNLNVTLPTIFNGDIDASVLRTGEIQNSHTAIKQREERTAFTPVKIVGRAGSGGAVLSFVMGDGTVRLLEEVPKP